MIKKYKVTASIYHDASNVKVIYVSANTQRKAIIIAVEKLIKKFNTNCSAVQIISCDLVT